MLVKIIISNCKSHLHDLIAIKVDMVRYVLNVIYGEQILDFNKGKNVI